MRADRLLALLLHLQARGRMTATELAAELEVSVRTIYRDIEALSAAGVPVYTETGPGGGCRLLEGYRAPLGGLSRDEAAALLVLGVPEPLRELGLEPALRGAQQRVRASVGLSPAATAPLVHLDLPRWFHSREAVPHLPTLADALGCTRRVRITYASGDGSAPRRRTIAPLGVVNKAGTWYVVATTRARHPSVFRVARVKTARMLDEQFVRPAEFDLITFWDAWSAEFQASRPRIPVVVRASPNALAVLPEVFGDAVLPALAQAQPDGTDGWRTLTLTFEHETAAAHRLTGFGGTIEVVSPPSIRDHVIATADATLQRHRK